MVNNSQRMKNYYILWLFLCCSLKILKQNTNIFTNIIFTTTVFIQMLQSQLSDKLIPLRFFNLQNMSTYGCKWHFMKSRIEKYEKL